MERDHYTCVYCGHMAVGLDHIIPRGHRMSTDNDDNLVAACSRCNTIAGSKFFNSLNEKRAYVLQNRTSFTCANCGKGAVLARWWQKYCSNACATKVHVAAYWRRRMTDSSLNKRRPLRP